MLFGGNHECNYKELDLGRNDFADGEPCLQGADPVKRIKALSGGFCSAVYLVETEQKMVLKVASDAQVKVMRHEREYVPTEAQMLRTLHEKDHDSLGRS